MALHVTSLNVFRLAQHSWQRLSLSISVSGSLSLSLIYSLRTSVTKDLYNFLSFSVLRISSFATWMCSISSACSVIHFSSFQNESIAISIYFSSQLPVQSASKSFFPRNMSCELNDSSYHGFRNLSLCDKSSQDIFEFCR